MKHIYASDCHTHSHCSPDGRDPVSAMLDRAAELGLYALTLTDHCEAQAFDGEYRRRAELARREMEEAARRCPKDLRFYRGIELGQAAQNPEAAREIWENEAYDFVIGSIHNLRNREDFYYLKYEPEKMADAHYLLTEYWKEELELVEMGCFDSLGHLTYPLRYMEGRAGLRIDLDRYREQTDAIFLGLIRRGRALELNTSGLRQELGRTMPDLPLLRRYRELGGELVTVGSDAHTTEDLAKGVDEGLALLREAGFTEFCVYEKHRPVFLPLR